MIEVKWTDLRRKDVDDFIEKTKGFDCSRFIPTKKEGSIDDEVTIHGEGEIRKFLQA